MDIYKKEQGMLVLFGFYKVLGVIKYIFVFFTYFLMIPNPNPTPPCSNSDVGVTVVIDK